ncbi:MAG TPA: elongation factor G [Planctomycetota bacterium]|nr:elongation factor G [Planctomycetota bacterium]
MSSSTIMPSVEGSKNVEAPKAAAKKSPNAIERIRNIGIAAHIDSGKTTITERMLKLSGRIRELGEVHDGEATMDFMKEEQERGITIGSAATHFQWEGHNVHLIDTPGHVDFTAEVERSLRVLDGAVLAIDSVAGAQAQSETVNRQMNKYSVPRIAFVNKMDRVGADFAKAVQSIQKRLHLNAVAIQLPVGEGAEFRGAVDLVRMAQINFPPGCDDPADFKLSEVEASMVEPARSARHALLEALSMYSDELMEILLAETEPPLELVRKVLREATCFHAFVPCMCGAALRNIGIPPLLTAVVDYLPSPLDKGAVKGAHPKNSEPLQFEPTPEAPLGSIVFKTVHFSTGDLTFVRIYSGTLNAGDALYNPRLGRNERVGRLFMVHAASREPIEKGTAGMIIACMGLKQAATGDTLCSKEAPIAYGSTTFAQPVISMAIEPVSSGDRDKLGEILGIITREDPTFRASTDPETGETIISGMGELHLEVISHRIRDEFNIHVTTGKPRVAYRQTFSKSAKIEARHIKQTGGSGQYAVAVVEVEPIEGDAVDFVDEITQGRITKEFLSSLEKGMRDHFLGGGRRGAQIQGIRCTVVDGKMHDVDSSSNAFYACGGLAARMAEEQCRAVLLEPIMRVEVTVPDDYLGSVLGDVNSRRGIIVDVGNEGMDKVIIARVPLAELAAYSTTLRSITSGRGNYTMEPDGYQQVPASVLEKLDKEAAKK